MDNEASDSSISTLRSRHVKCKKNPEPTGQGGKETVDKTTNYKVKVSSLYKNQRGNANRNPQNHGEPNRTVPKEIPNLAQENTQPSNPNTKKRRGKKSGKKRRRKETL